MASTNKYVAVKEEVTPGTVDAPFTFAGGAKAIDAMSFAVGSTREPILEETIRRREMVEREDGIVRETGTIDLLADPEEIAYFLKWFFGGVTTTAAGDSNAHRHDFTPQDALLTFTAEDFNGIGTQARQFVDMFIRTIRIEARPREAVTFSMDVTAQKHTLVSNQTAADTDFSTAKIFAGYQAVVKVNAATETRVETMSVTLENRVDEDAYLLGSQFYDSSADGPRVEGFNASWDMEVYFKNQLQHERFLDDSQATPTAYGTLTGSNVKLTITGRATASASAGFTAFVLDVEIPDTIYETSEVRHERQTRIVQRISGRAIYHTGFGSSVKVQVINETASL